MKRFVMLMIWPGLVFAGQQARRESVQATEIEPLVKQVKTENEGEVSGLRMVASSQSQALSIQEARRGAGSPLGTAEVRVEERNGGGDVYVPFGWQCNWAYNEIYNPAYPHTDNGIDAWLEIKEDGLGALWASYTGTDASYNNDTVFVFCSLDGGLTWLYSVAIYVDQNLYPGTHVFSARLSVDRVNNWVYIAMVLGDEAGGGSYYYGDFSVARFQHLGGGTIGSLSSVTINSVFDQYGEVAVAADGSSNGRVYAAGIGQFVFGGVYMDYYRSDNWGASFNYISSFDLGTNYTTAISASPIVGGNGALITWCEWDDAADADGSTPPENDFDIYFGWVNSGGESWYHFNNGGSGFRGVLGPAAYTNQQTVIGFAQENGPYDFDGYFYATVDGGATWTLYHHWNELNPGYDTRSLQFDVTPEGGGTYYMSYFEDDDDADHAGRPFFYYASSSDLSTWYVWDIFRNPSYNYGPAAVDNDLITVGASEHMFLTSTAALFYLGDWQPHVAWRRTSGAQGGGDPWHSYPLAPVYFSVDEGDGARAEPGPGPGILLMTPGKDLSGFAVFNLDGRRAQDPQPGKLYYIVPR